MNQHTELIKRIQSVMTPDLLKKGFEGPHPLSGHCYVASEALYHLLGGQDSEWYPVRARDAQGICHWWLENLQGDRLDVTQEQYTSRGEQPPYGKGRRGGFLTKNPSNRAKKALSRLHNQRNPNDHYDFRRL